MFRNKHSKMISATIIVLFKSQTKHSVYIVKPESRHIKLIVSQVSQKSIFSKILVFKTKRLRNRAKIKNKKNKKNKKDKKRKKKRVKKIKQKKTD